MTHIPKLVEIHIEIHPDGTLHATPAGTEGAECLDILKFLRDLQGAKIQKMETNADYHKGDGEALLPIILGAREDSA